TMYRHAAQSAARRQRGAPDGRGSAGTCLGDNGAADRPALLSRRRAGRGNRAADEGHSRRRDWPPALTSTLTFATCGGKAWLFLAAQPFHAGHHVRAEEAEHLQRQGMVENRTGI